MNKIDNQKSYHLNFISVNCIRENVCYEGFIKNFLKIRSSKSYTRVMNLGLPVLNFYSFELKLKILLLSSLSSK